MKTYTTSEVARMIGIHPNTVRMYEDWGLVSAPARKSNGYRVYTELHIKQFEIARTALQIEVLQNGLRKKVIEIIKASADRDFEKAVRLTDEYIQQVRQEKVHAEEAIRSTEGLLSGDVEENLSLKRQEAANYLGISIDTLRNWERNGLLAVKRKDNGYRMYSEEDIRRLKIIRSLRCANYSLSAILRMLLALSGDPQVNIREVIDTPDRADAIISTCDKLLTSLQNAEDNALDLRRQLFAIQKLI